MSEYEYIKIDEYLANAEDEAETDGDRMFLKTAGFVHPEVIYNYLINAHPKYIKIRQEEDATKSIVDKITKALLGGQITIEHIKHACVEYISQCREINEAGKTYLIGPGLSPDTAMVNLAFEMVHSAIKCMKVAFRPDPRS